MAKLLGPAGYGVFSYALALVALLSIPSELGVPNLAVREIAVANARKNWGQMRGFIAWAHATVAITSGVLVIIGSAALLTWGHHLTPSKAACLWLGLLLVPMLSLGALRDAMLRGLRKVLLGQLPQPIIRPLALLIMLAVLWQLGTDLSKPEKIMQLHIISVGIGFAFGVFFFLKFNPAELRTAEREFRSSIWLKSSIPFGLTAALQLINGRTDIIMLGFFRSDAEIGVYRVAAQLGATVIFAMQAINVVQGPHIAHLFAQGDMKKLQRMITRSAQAVLLFAVPVVIVIILFGEYIIGFIYGEAYQAAYLPLVILCAGQLVNAAMGAVGSLLNMTGHERDTMKSVLMAAIVNVVLSLTLIPLFGIVGAAIATASTLTVWNFVMWRKVRERIGIESSPIFRRFK
jgi:O-antigen/teichoic acid export membrane protein